MFPALILSLYLPSAHLLDAARAMLAGMGGPGWLKITNEHNYSLLWCASLAAAIGLGIALRYKGGIKDAKLKESLAVAALKNTKDECEAMYQQLAEQQKKLLRDIALKEQQLAARSIFMEDRNLQLQSVLAGLLKLSEVKQKTGLAKSLSALRRYLTSPKEAESYATHFEQVDRGFLRRVLQKHPGLQSNDIRLLCYIYMNLSQKEIASALNISQEAVRKRKERLVQRMGLDVTIPLVTYLTTI